MKITVRKSFYDEYFNSLEKSHFIDRWRKDNKWRYKYTPNKGGKENHYQGKKNKDNGRKTLSIHSIVEMRPKEIIYLKNCLHKEKYENINGAFVSGYKVNALKGKISKEEKIKAEKELKAAQYLSSKGLKVYLLREGYTTGRSADTLSNNKFIELKQIDSSKNVGANYSSSRGQSSNVFLYIDTDVNERRVIRQIKSVIAERLRKNEDVFGNIYIYLKKADKYFELKIDTVGNVERINKAAGDWQAIIHQPTCLNIAHTVEMSTPNINEHITIKKNVASEIMKTLVEYSSGDILNKSLTFSGWKLQGRTTFRGLNISIENRKGSIRRGTDHNGEKWAIKMNYDYGYIRGTEGVDGDHVDCYLGGNEDAKNVYIVHQNDPDTHKYDEDKCMLGFDTLADARKAYLSQYNKPGFLGKIDIMPFEDFKEKVVLKKNHGKKLVTKSLNDYVKEIKSGFDFDMMKRVAL